MEPEVQKTKMTIEEMKAKLGIANTDASWPNSHPKKQALKERVSKFIATAKKPDKVLALFLKHHSYDAEELYNLWSVM